ncbi:Phosphatidylinositol transfer protein 3 isoform A [Glycine soja]|uniref:Polyphosphoinositide binding protein Ssh2p n=2 Tax=Glycine subgen. Soja TaxID=1462606 RepID=A0A0R0K6D8_SOYBN|nr:Phosphatidylinositol transfer protein 3 isoform A [Glycine soja]
MGKFIYIILNSLYFIMCLFFHQYSKFIGSTVRITLTHDKNSTNAGLVPCSQNQSLLCLCKLQSIPTYSVALQIYCSQEEDDFMIRRFLRARDLDVEKASAMLLKYLKWRNSFVPNGSVSVSDVPNELAQDKVFMQGHDKIGRPILMVFGGRHFQNKDGLDEFKRFVVYVLDKVCASMPPGQEKFVGIAELKGWGYSNSDVRGYLSALSILQDYYPERLGKLFIVNAPYIFMKVWQIVYPFIDNKTKKKIVFVEKNKVKSTLLEEMEESQVPEIFGGSLPLVPIQDS